MSATTSTRNEAVFLLDGSNFFSAVDAALKEVLLSDPDPLTYVRMAFWMAQHDMPMVDPVAAAGRTAGNMLEDRLQALAIVGHPSEIILYRPSDAELYGESKFAGGGLGTDLFQVNERTHKFLDQWTVTGDPQAGTVRVFLEKVDRYVPGASNHQKLVICSIAGQRKVFLGGFNLLADYWDTPAHDYASTWHDTGVRLRGPATDAVEAEWMRRWAKSGLPATPNRTVQANYPDVGGQTVKVTIATTNAEGWFREPDIQSELTRLIGTARTYAYFENYGFTDPTLVDALRARLAGDAPPAVLVNLAWPKPPMGFNPVAPYDYLDYISWSKLALQDCTSADLPDPAHHGTIVNVPRAEALVWRIRESDNSWSTARSIHSTFANRWMENDALEWQLPGGPVHLTRLIDIAAIHGGTRFATTARATSHAALEPVYIHSKLALFDDATAVVGTANFTYRSMVYDGEMAAIIENPTVVTAIRQTLLPHFNTAGGAALDPANFTATAAANRAAYGGGTLTNGALYVLSLEMVDYSKVPPQNPLNFTWF